MYRTLTLGILLGACTGNQSGNTSAPDGGDTSNDVAKGSPIAALDEACGAGAPTAAGVVLARQPYLQQVTTTAAKIGWVTTQPGAQRVEVTLPDGKKVTSAAAVEEKEAEHGSGQHQMWASLEGLTPDTLYCYEISDGSVLQARTGFRTAPAANDPDPVRFLAFGDSGGDTAEQHALAEQMFEFSYDLMIHTGDIAYDSGSLQQFETTVFDVYGDLMSRIPFFPAPGNHDYGTSKGAPFRSVFALPGDSGEKWYSYDWGRVHFVALDTESDYATQAKWLDTDLAATQQPWKIVYLHRPPYSSGEHGSDTSLRSKLAPILEKHHVQLVLAGHDHDYERMKPQNGVAYVVTGGGGVGTRPVGKSAFTAFAAEVIHFVVAEVSADRLVLHAIDAEGREFDSMVIAK